MIFEHIKGGAYISASKRFPPLNHIFRCLIPKHLMAKRTGQLTLTKEKVERRIKTKTDQTDFLSFILRQCGRDKGMPKGWSLNWENMARRGKAELRDTSGRKLSVL